MKKITKTALKKQLQTQSQGELIDLVLMLYSTVPEAVDYINIEYGGEEYAHELLSKAKRQVRNEFFPARGMGRLSLSTAKAAIRDFGAQELPSLAAVETAEDSEVYTAVDGVLFKKDEEGKSTLVLYPSAKEGKDYVIPEETAAVSEHAFSKTANLDTIVIGSDLEKVEAGAFPI